jgi:NAD+--asparagine ADP-ribosyltransferase
MKRHLIGYATIGALSVVCILARGESETAERSNSSSQYQPPEQLRIAFVDIAALFKKHTRFRAKMDELKRRVDAEAKEVNGEDKIIDNQEQKNKLDEKIKIQKEQFEREEGVIYFDTIESINREIRRCCKQHRIQVAIRFSGEPIDPTNREDILRSINRAITYFDPSLDITDEVLAGVNANDPNAN